MNCYLLNYVTFHKNIKEEYTKSVEKYEKALDELNQFIKNNI